MGMLYEYPDADSADPDSDIEIRMLDSSTVPDTYISFATPGQFLGAVVIANPDFDAAVEETVQLGLYPGGEAACFLVPAGAYPRNRLLTMEDLPNATMVKDLDAKNRQLVEENCVKFCGSCIARKVQ